MQYCPHCRALTGTLDARPEWYSPPQFRCSRCGNMLDKDEDEDDEGDSDEDGRLPAHGRRGGDSGGEGPR